MDKYFEAAGIISPQVLASPASDRLLVRRLRGEEFTTGPVAKYAHGGQMLTSNGTMSTKVNFPSQGHFSQLPFSSLVGPLSPTRVPPTRPDGGAHAWRPELIPQENPERVLEEEAPEWAA